MDLNLTKNQIIALKAIKGLMQVAHQLATDEGLVIAESIDDLATAADCLLNMQIKEDPGLRKGWLRIILDGREVHLLERDGRTLARIERINGCALYRPTLIKHVELGMTYNLTRAQEMIEGLIADQLAKDAP